MSLKRIVIGTLFLLSIVFVAVGFLYLFGITGFVAEILCLCSVVTGLIYLTHKSKHEDILFNNRAVALIKKNINANPGIPIEAILSTLDFKDINKSHAQYLLEEFANMISVPAEKLPFNIPLWEFILIKKTDLGLLSTSIENDISYIHPYTYSLVYLLEDMTDASLWRQRQQIDPNLPGNEDDLADFVLQMTLTQLVVYFAPLVSDQKLRKRKRYSVK